MVRPSDRAVDRSSGGELSAGSGTHGGDLAGARWWVGHWVRSAAGRVPDVTGHRRTFPGPSQRSGQARPGHPPPHHRRRVAPPDSSGQPRLSIHEGGRVAGARIETVHQHEEAGTSAAAVVVPVTAEGEPTSWGFVGRDQELAALLALLDPHPESSAGAVTSVVSGMAGVGKTALAWQAARTAVGRGWFPGGALVVDLHGDDPDPAAQVAPERVHLSLLRALDPDWPVAVRPATVEELASAYRHLMSHLDQVSRPVLLVVDNADNTDQITGLLPAGRAHRVLVTSRRPLKELPGARLLEVDVLAPDLAVELLGARRPGDPRLDANPAAAAELARLCGHLPLALQIIAVLMADDPARPTAELVAELAEETTRLQSSPCERWAGRAAVEMAYRRLDDFAARVFRLLAAAPGSDRTAEAAAALTDQPVEQVHQALAALTRVHLLECRQPGRWRMHDLIRRHATELATAQAHHDGQDQAIARLAQHHQTTRRLSGQPAHQVSTGYDTAAHAVGGSSATPLVARMFSGELGRPMVVNTHQRDTQPTKAAVHTTDIPPRDTSVPPRPPLTETIRRSTLDRRQRRHWLRRAAAAALVIAMAVTVVALLKPFTVHAGTGAARLALSTSQVKIGDSYFATASGFSPGEGVRFSWTGPSDGVMGVFPADSGGRKSHGPVLERHPPGSYTITVTGMTTGRSASVGLQVVTGTGAARLVLSTSQVKIGDTYFATAWGFSPGENVRLSINRANNLMGVFPADSGGSGWHRVLEKDPPGNYMITVTGLTSGRTASAGLQVVQPGN
jgi:hypothetical protein